MKRFANRIHLLALTFVTTLLFVAPEQKSYAKPANDDKSMVAATVVLQVHRPIGTMELVITKDALRINCKDFRTTVLAAAPDWHVCYFSPATRLVRNWTYTNFVSYGTSLSVSPEYPAIPKGKSVSTPVVGLTTDCYSTVDKNGETFAVCNYPLKDINPKIFAILAKLYRIPNLGGVPLEAYSESLRHEKKGVTPWLPGKEFDGKTHRSHRLETHSLKQIKVAANDLKYPAGFKQTEDESSISFGHRADGLVDFLTGEGDLKSNRKPLVKPITEPNK